MNSIMIRVCLKGKSLKNVLENQRLLIEKTGLTRKTLGKNRVIEIMLANACGLNVEIIDNKEKHFLITKQLQ